MFMVKPAAPSSTHLNGVLWFKAEVENACVEKQGGAGAGGDYVKDHAIIFGACNCRGAEELTLLAQPLGTGDKACSGHTSAYRQQHL
jgi:hypothetical protein